MQLRDYQEQGCREIDEAWAAGAWNVLYVLPTGGGKTPIFAEKLRKHQGASCAIAHRQQLVSQISITLGRNEVKHRIIGPEKLIREIDKLERRLLGRSFYDCQAPCAVAGIDTLIRRGAELKGWLEQVTLVTVDEGHHPIRGNKWGRGIEMLPNARGLFVTATPYRADGLGLGRHADGYVDAMVVGPTPAELIARGFLCDYDLYCPESDIDYSHIDISGATGDWNNYQLRKEVKKSHIVGDVVEKYLEHAPGKTGITFAVDIENATDIARAFNEAGVPAAAISKDTPIRERYELQRRLECGELKQLVNVDIFGEGYDVPAIQVVSMARPSESEGLIRQQMGRGLRPKEDGSRAILIDHTGSIVRHNWLPDSPRFFTLDAREKRGKRPFDPQEIPLTACPECTKPYERTLSACPFCAYVPEPGRRGSPELVDGDLVKVDRAVIEAMRRRILEVDRDPGDIRAGFLKGGAGHAIAMNAANNQARRQASQVPLRQIMGVWAGQRRGTESETHKAFYLRFGVDVLSAQALNRKDAQALSLQLLGDL